MTVKFECTTVLPTDIETAFALALDIDEHLASMASSGERVIGGVRTGTIGLGEEVTWRARHFGVPFTMTSRITALERPSPFVDEQVRGPFRRFRHEHRFEVVDGGTRLFDEVEFDAPFGPIGRVFERLLLERYLRQLIDQRNAHLLRVAAARPAVQADDRPPASGRR
jgi:ligand-binding SRPBCC domain-containing protein